MTINRDDQMISGTEFRIRRLAIGLTQPVIQNHLNVQRSALDRWQQGRSRIPSKAREMLEIVESDIDATVEYLVDTETKELPASPHEDWPWGDDAWFVVVAAARYKLGKNGIKAVIA